MRRLVVETLTLALVLGVASIGMGQPTTPPATDPNAAAPSQFKPAPSKPSKSKLEEMLAEALKSNPDIRVAAAKQAEADAELNRTRLQVTQKVVALYYAIDTQKKTVEHQEAKFHRMERLFKSATASNEELAEARQVLSLAKAKLAELEAQMPALLGKVAHEAEGKVTDALLRAETLVGPTRLYPLVGVAQLIRTPSGNRLAIINPPSQRTTGPMADKIRTALDKPISLKVNNLFVSEVLAELQKFTGVTFKLIADGLPEPKLNLEFTDLSLRAALQLIEDSEPGYSFVVREYGILLAPQAKLPPGALTVQQFLSQKPAGK